MTGERSEGTEVNIIDQERLRAILSDARKKSQHYFDKYQQTGSKSSYNTYVYYDDLVTICIMAEKQIADDEAWFRKHRNNINAYFDRITEDGKKKEYTLEDVQQICTDVLFM